MFKLRNFIFLFCSLLLLNFEKICKNLILKFCRLKILTLRRACDVTEMSGVMRTYIQCLVNVSHSPSQLMTIYCILSKLLEFLRWIDRQTDGQSTWMIWIIMYLRSCTNSINQLLGAAVAEWLSSWLVEQEDRGSIPRLAT